MNPEEMRSLIQSKLPKIGATGLQIIMDAISCYEDATEHHTQDDDAVGYVEDPPVVYTWSPWLKV